MYKAGYSLINTATVCSAMSALACICSAFLTNLPFVVSPPAAVSVFLAVYLVPGWSTLLLIIPIIWLRPKGISIILPIS